MRRATQSGQIVSSHAWKHNIEIMLHSGAAALPETPGNRRYPQANPFADFIINVSPLENHGVVKGTDLETNMPRFGFWFPFGLTVTNPQPSPLHP